MPPVETSQAVATIYAVGAVAAAWMVLREPGNNWRDPITWIVGALLVAAWPLWAIGSLLVRQK